MEEQDIQAALAEALIFKHSASIYVRKLQAYRDLDNYDAANELLHEIARTTKLSMFQRKTEDVILLWAGANSLAGLYHTFNGYIGWLQDRIVQCDLVGQTLDYTEMPIETILPLGGLIEACPRCGQSARMQYKNRSAMTIHEERFESWHTTVILKSCDL